MKEIKVLEKGFVKLVDYMGDDSSIVQAARVSYGEGTKTIREDRDLIRYLMRNKHSSPMEMVEFKFHIKCPIYVFRQIIRHRTFSTNEISLRYSIVKDEFDLTLENEWRVQSKNNKQGSEGLISKELGISFTDKEKYIANNAKSAYDKMIVNEVAREQARKVLPVSLYTEAYWKGNLHNLFHFLGLRLDSHAQQETREYAEALFNLIKPIVPISCEAFEDYRLNAVQFSSRELKLIQKALKEGMIPDRKWIKENANGKHPELELSQRERREFRIKLNRNVDN